MRWHKEMAFRMTRRKELLRVTPWGINLLFPAQSLATCFGSGDADYAISTAPFRMCR